MSSERTDDIQISNFSSFNRFSTSGSNRAMDRFTILILIDITWETRFTLEKNTNYSSNSTEWSY